MANPNPTANPLTHDPSHTPLHAPDFKQIAESLKTSTPIPTPPDYIEFLEKVRCLQPLTVKLYDPIASRFLTCMALLHPNETPSLEMAYNPKHITDFFSIMKPLISDATAPNYHSGTQAIRRYCRFYGKCPDHYARLDEGFISMASVAQSKKKRHLVSKRKLQRRQGKSNLLSELHRKFYEGPVWEDFFSLMDRGKAALEENRRVKKLTKTELQLCTSVLIGALTVCNFKRPGDFRQIQYEDSQKQFRRAVKKFEKKFPGESMILGKGKLDRTKSTPVELVIDECSKVRGVGFASLLHPRDVYAMHLFCLYGRPYGPSPPKTTSLFINSKGRSLGSDVGRYLRNLGELSGVKGLSFNTLRSLAETENVLDGQNQVSRAVEMVTSHLGHSESVRDEYYTRDDRRHHEQAADRLLSICEREGARYESEDEESEEEGNNDVAGNTDREVG